MAPLEQEKLIARALMDNEHAIALFKDLAWASQLIDDFWDGDKPVSRDGLLQALLVLTVDIPRNPVYRSLPDDVIRIIEDALCFWVQSNDIEERAAMLKEVHAYRLLQVSYIKRSVMTDVLIQLARLVGGRQHERAIALEVREAVYLDNEVFANYFKEHRGGSQCA